MSIASSNLAQGRKKLIFLATVSCIVLYGMYCIGYIVAEHDQSIASHSPNVIRSQDTNKTILTTLTTDQLFRMTNDERQKAGLNLLDYSPYLEASAINKCNDMVKRDYWQHNAPDGTEPWVFIHKLNINYKEAGENLAYGYPDTNSVIRGWMSSQEHRSNILDLDFNKVGFGICKSSNYQKKGPQTIIVQHFIQE